MAVKCLVFGATGFLGKNLCQTLINNNIDVWAYSSLTADWKFFINQFPNIKIIKGDFVRENNFDEILKDIDVAFHLVSTTKPANKDLFYDINSNVLPSIRLFEACVKQNVKLIYFSSGGTVYGQPEYIPIDENHKKEPISAYGLHKLTVENILKYYGYCYNLEYIIMRISNPYGKYQTGFDNQGVVTVFLNKALSGETINIWGDGECIRDFIYVDDVMDAALKFITYKGAYKIFNVGSGKGCSLNSLLYKIKFYIKREIRVKYMPARSQDVKVNVLDNSLAKKEIGWDPIVNIDQGIEKMLRF